MSLDSSGTPTRYFFVHMQKTAGTSLLLRLQHHFGERAVYPYEERAGYRSSFSVEDLRACFEEDGEVLRVVAGHFPLGVAYMLGVPFTTFTILRDPVERTLSFLRQQQERAPEFANATLEEIYDEPFRRAWLLTNHMVRMLGQNAAEVEGGTIASDEENLERAKQSLTDELDIFGFQEDFESFCTELTNRYGWDLGPAVRANTTAPLPAPEGLRERIALDNAADVELYRYARALRDQGIDSRSA